MSIYGQLDCKDCKQSIFLGKAIRDDRGALRYFVVGTASTDEYRTLSRAVFKFFAEHVGHDIAVLYDYQWEDLYGDEENWLQIGDDDVNGISFDKYLKGWPGWPR